MTKTNILAFLFFAFLLNKNVMAQADGNSAVEYMNTIGNQFHAVSKELMSYTSAASHGKSAKKIEKRRNDLLKQLKIAEANVRRLKPFEKDASYRDTVAHYFDISYRVINNEYSKIVDMEEIAEQSYNDMEAYMLAKEKANEKLDAAFEKVENQHKAFADKHHIRLVSEKSSLDQKLETSGKVYAYYNQIYLIFFKSYKDEIYLLEALKKGNVSSKEQTKNALSTSSTEGLVKIGPISDFKGDNTLKTACQQILSFYKDEANNKVSSLIEFELKKENFEKIKKTFDSKNQSDRTQADIDIYNNAVVDFNNSVGKVNAISEEINKRRQQTLDNWNKVSDKFLDKHVPKY